MASGVARRAQAQGQPVAAVPVDGGFAVQVGEAQGAQGDAAPRRITWQRRSGRRVWDGSDGTVIADHSIGSTKTFMAFAGNAAYDRGENFATGDTLTEAKRLAETAPRPGQETAQPDVDAVDTSPQRVDETADNRQVEGDPTPAESPQNDAESRPREQVTWGVNYTEQPGIGRTTETRTFPTLREAREFAADKRGYITRISDGGNRIDPSEGSTRFHEYIGDFEPSAQEGQIIRAMTGEDAPAPVQRHSRRAEADALTLETQTEESLAAQEREQQQAQQAEADQRRQEEQRAQADAEVDDFNLSGSDREADVAASRGQEPLFSLRDQEGMAMDEALRDTQVVDEDGNPRVVHHATFDEFETFDFNRLGSFTQGNVVDDALVETARMGAWFSERSVAKDGAAPYSYDAYLNIENPADFNGIDHLMGAIEDAGDAAALKTQLQEEGFDGIRMQDDEFDTVSWVAFGPEQIRRADATRYSISRPDYQIEHSPMTDEGGASRLNDLTGAFGEDIYGPNALQFFGSGDGREAAVVRKLKRLRGKPDAPVTIYRGAPGQAEGINPGDWVTLIREAAQDYADGFDDGKVISKQVPAKDVTSWADSLLEFGYFPTDDPRYSFAGERAETADTHSLDRAQSMLAQGHDGETVRRETGWFIGADGKPRFEIDDSDARFLPFVDKSVGDLWTKPLEEVLDHPKLFAAYPGLRDVDVVSARGMGTRRGQMNSQKREIMLNADRDAMDQFSTLLHEVQHGIQHIEGFATGGDPSSYRLPPRREQWLRDKVQELTRESGDFARDVLERYKAGEITSDQAQQRIQQRADEIGLNELRQKLREGDARGAYRFYQRLAGEVEARNVQARQGMTEAERRDTAPSETQDVPDSDVVVVYNGQEMADAPEPANAADMPQGARPTVTLADDVSAALEGVTELGDVQVVQTVNDLPAGVRDSMARQSINGRDVRGVYVGDELYVVADNVRSVQEGIEVAVHEAVGHKGIRGVLGADLDRVMQGLYRSLPNSPEGRQALREVRQAYPFLDPSKKADQIAIAEEMVAHLLEKGHRPKAWQRAVAKIRELLRRTFPMVAWTYTDALALGEKSRDYLRRQQAERQGDAGSRFAMAGDTTSRNFKRLASVLGSESAARDMVSGSDKARVNSLKRNTEAITNLLESETSPSQADGFSDIPASVIPHVLRVTNNKEVLGSIVRSIPVDVVNLLRRKEISPEKLLSNKTMLEDMLSVNSESTIPLGIDEATARSLISTVARKAAEVSTLADRALEIGTTSGAGARDSVSGAQNDSSSVNYPEGEGTTESTPFSTWFGDSKVVDENGEPLVVYHGSTDRLDVIEPGYDEPGAWFTTSFQTAGQYAKGDNPTMHDVYLKAEKPLVADFNDWEGDGPIELNGEEFEDNVAIVEYAERNGYDSVHFPIGNFTEDAETWVVFDASQVKSATENQGAYDAANPDIRYSLRGKQRVAFESQFDDFTDADRAAAAKIGSPTVTKGIAQWWKERTNDWRTKVRQGVVDSAAALQRDDEQLYGKQITDENISQRAWVLARMAKAAPGVTEVLLKDSRVEWNAKEQVFQPKDDDSMGLVAVFAQLGGEAETRRFLGWIAGNRADKLRADGRENLFDDGDIDAMKDWDRGNLEDGRSRRETYDRVFKEFQQYRDDVLAAGVELGVISQEQHAQWRDEFYVPFYRISEEKGFEAGQLATSGLSRQQAVRKLKGGTSNLNDLLENTLMNFNHIIESGLKNNAARQAIRNAEDLGAARKVPNSAPQTGNVTWVMDEGQKVSYEIDDPLTYNALASLQQTGMNSSLMKVMRGFKRLLTNTVTVTPQFMLANFFRDSIQAPATSDVSKNVLTNILDGHKTLRDRKMQARIKAAGGSFSFGHLYGANNADETRAGMTRNLRDTGLQGAAGATLVGIGNAASVVRQGWAKWNDLNNHFENVNRAAIFKQRAESGSSLRAAFEARDLMDFSSHGGWGATRVLIDIIPFLNARIQGLDKIYRSGVRPGASVIKDALRGKTPDISDRQLAGRFWAVAGAVSLGMLAAYLENYDEEWYKELEEWEKDTYTFFNIGNHRFALPNPFEVGAIGTMMVRTAEQFVNDEATGELFVERMGHMLTETFAMDMPQMFRPAIDVYSNKDSFTQRPIENMGMQRLSPELRRRYNTPAFSVGISKALNSTVGALGSPDTNPLALSPVQVDYLINGYFGQVGSWFTGMTDTAWRFLNGDDAPDRRLYERQPIRRFYQNLDDVDGYTRYGSIFYDGLTEAKRAYADFTELRELGHWEEAKEVFEERRDMLALRTGLNRAQRMLSKYNKQIDAIRRDKSIDGELKRQRIDRIMAKKNMIQRTWGERILETRAN